MAVTPKIKTPVEVKTLGTSVGVHRGSTIYSGLSSPGVSASTVKQSGGLPAPVAVNAGDVLPNANPAAFYVTRNNRLLGPFADLQVAKDTIAYVESRELEIGTDI